MGFKDFPYERPTREYLESELVPLLERFENAASADEQIGLIDDIVRVRNRCESMESIARIRFDCDTSEEFYSAEGDYFDEFSPVYEGYVARFGRAYANSKFFPELTEHFGAQAGKIYALTAKVYDDKILPLLQKENALVRQYDKLLAASKIEFRGETKNLSQMRPHIESADREERREANDAFFGFFADNLETLDGIYDGLVKTRTEMARALGYDDFVQMGYDRLNRAYSQADAKKFRDGVLEHIVPLAGKLRERQRRRLGLDKLEHYDLGAMFKNGNPVPLGGDEWQMDRAREMFGALSPETAEFFAFMSDNGLYDLPARANKSGGGYCDVIAEHGAPFIFSNSAGTADDVTTITHESGHAFQVYRAMKRPTLPECVFPALDACEIHSTSMEYLTWPYMESFFGEATKKFEFSHISEMMVFIPYSAAVDEFQHLVYSTPDASPAERRRLWRDTEKKYMPYLDYGDNALLQSGGRFFRQSHIISDPFYYLDYALADVCAIQVWKRSLTDREGAWKDYLTMCDIGGRLDLFGITKAGHIEQPLSENAVQDTAAAAAKWLNDIDDTAF